MTNVAVIYYSSTGNAHALAQAVAEGARQSGAEVRLRRVAELAPAEAIDANPAWRAHADSTAHVPVASREDHRSAIVVAPGYTDDAVSAAGGNPYGTAHPSGAGLPGERTLQAARDQGRRLARIAALLASTSVAAGGSVGR